MKKILFGIMALAVLAMFSCNNAGLGPAIGGTVLLSFDDGVTPARSMLPTQSMDIATYDIYGVFEDPAETFEQLDVPGTTGTLVIPDLLSGTWTITVNGKNAAGTVIGTGSDTAIVTPTSQGQASVAVTPMTGTGTFDFEVTWTAAVDTEIKDIAPLVLGGVIVPTVYSQLFPYGGAPADLVFDTSVALTATSISPQTYGYYTLLTRFAGTEETSPGIFVDSIVAGNAEVVRIASGVTTSGSYLYDDVNTNPVGSIDITISPELGEPLVIDLTPNVDGNVYSYKTSDTFTMDATTSSTPDTVDWTWYVNGVEYMTGPTLLYDTQDFPRPGLVPFKSNISVIGYSNAGTRAGNATVEITTTRK